MTVVFNTDIVSNVPVANVGLNEDFFVTEGTVLVNTAGDVFIGDPVFSDIHIAGAIYGSGSGISLSSGSNTNVVTISGTGSIIGEASNGISITGEQNLVANNGEIASGGLAGIRLNGNANYVSNSGIVTASGQAAGSAAIVIAGNTGEFVNTGLIQTNGSAAAAVIFFHDESATSFTSNFGTITSPTRAYLGGSGLDTLINGGTIIGEVQMNDGDDTYRASGDGVVIGTVDGEEGRDMMIGGALSDVFNGGAGIDMLRGQGGDDVLLGGGGADELRGGDGSDVLEGQGGDDDLRGENGHDEIDGGGGDDTIRGGSGDDVIIGNVGLDILFGNSGADVFVYANETHSTDDATRDVIRDFTSGEDVIDLSELPGNLDFIGEGSFSGTAGEVRFTANASGNSTIRIDVDGDGSADMRIVLIGVDDLTESDFFL